MPYKSTPKIHFWKGGKNACGLYDSRKGIIRATQVTCRRCLHYLDSLQPPNKRTKQEQVVDSIVDDILSHPSASADHETLRLMVANKLGYRYRLPEAKEPKKIPAVYTRVFGLPGDELPPRNPTPRHCGPC